MVTDPIGELLTRMRNAQNVNHRSLRVPSSKMTRAILTVLCETGFITAFERVKRDKFEELEVQLKYHESGEPLMDMIERISTPGRRVYKKSGALPRVLCGLGILIVSTSAGVMSDKEARKRKLGGELLARVG